MISTIQGQSRVISLVFWSLTGLWFSVLCHNWALIQCSLLWLGLDPVFWALIGPWSNDLCPDWASVQCFEPWLGLDPVFCVQCPDWPWCSVLCPDWALIQGSASRLCLHEVFRTLTGHWHTVQCLYWTLTQCSVPWLIPVTLRANLLGQVSKGSIDKIVKCCFRACLWCCWMSAEWTHYLRFYRSQRASL